MNPERGPGALLKAACLESQRLWAQTPLWHSSLKQNVYSPLTRED